MNRSAISLIIWSIALILAQVLIFNHICLFGYAVAFIFIYTLVKIPMSMTLEWRFTIAFLLGLIIDIFSDTLGMNALACTIIMGLRRPIIRLYVVRDDEVTDTYPGYNSFGTFSFVKYVITLTLLYCTLFYLIESFFSIESIKTIFQILASTILTALLILGIDSLTVQKNEKRL